MVLARSHEGGEAGFTRNLWLFAPFFTMSSTVWMEMLAKPWALARAQGSPASVPRPLRSLRRRSRRVSRYVRSAVPMIATSSSLQGQHGQPDREVPSPGPFAHRQHHQVGRERQRYTGLHQREERGDGGQA